jgi:hypothetical protein
MVPCLKLVGDFINSAKLQGKRVDNFRFILDNYLILLDNELNLIHN